MKLIVCDLSWLMYRSYYTYLPENGFYYERGGTRYPNGHIYGVFRTLITLKQRFPECKIVLCKDGIPKDRIELMGGSVEKNADGSYKVERGMYKEGRNSLSYNLHQDSDDICRVSTILPGVGFAEDEYLEADDIMYTLAKRGKDKFDRIYIMSGDNDLLQAVDDKICVLRSLALDAPVMDETWVRERSEFAVEPSYLPMYRAMRGDHSDNIESIYPRISKAFCRYVAESFSSTDEISWYQVPNGDIWEKWWQRIQKPDIMALLERNYKLMKLSDDHDIEVCTSAGLTKEEALDYLDAVKCFSACSYIRRVVSD